ncbi:nucleoside triphosphate pyrophosphohydrolase, partial [Streptomyces anthocyanicus]
MGYVRGVNATSSSEGGPTATDPGRIVLLTTSHRVAPGLLS